MTRATRAQLRERRQADILEDSIQYATFCGKPRCIVCEYIKDKRLELRDSVPK
jgi:hypothetical protein